MSGGAKTARNPRMVAGRNGVVSRGTGVRQ
jgi:hypothetical protein